MDDTLSQDLSNVLSAFEDYRRNEPRASAQLVRMLEAMKMHVEGPSAYLGRMRYQPLLNICVTVAIETGILDALVSQGGAPVTSKDIAQQTGQDETLVSMCKAMGPAGFSNLMRILRQLHVNGVCDESGPTTYASNSITGLLSTPEYRGACTIMHEIGFMLGANITRQIHDTGIQMFAKQPADKTPFQYTYGMHWFDYLGKNPEHKRAFDAYMIGRQNEIKSSWVDLFPVNKVLERSASSTENLVVDIGGGVGKDLLSLRSKLASVPTRLILEELPETLKGLDDLDHHIEKIEYNFLKMDQPVKGAKIYFMHGIIHDWSDEQASMILQSTSRAMKKDYSVLLMQDIVLPDTGADWRGSAIDIMMLLFPGGMERTQAQWQKLLDWSGLELVKVWSDEKMIESVIEARLKV